MEEKSQQELETEIGIHLMSPQNYGKLEDADGVGAGIDNATNSYIVMYLKFEDDCISDVKFGTNAHQDATTLGSLFTEMIKGDKLSNILKEVAKLEKDLVESYALVEAPEVDLTKPEGEQVGRVNTEPQDNANMVLTAFRAAMRHHERKEGGVVEDHFEMNIAKTCPYSMTDCHFVQKVDEVKKDS